MEVRLGCTFHEPVKNRRCFRGQRTQRAITRRLAGASECLSQSARPHLWAYRHFCGVGLASDVLRFASLKAARKCGRACEAAKLRSCKGGELEYMAALLSAAPIRLPPRLFIVCCLCSGGTASHAGKPTMAMASRELISDQGRRKGSIKVGTRPKPKPAIVCTSRVVGCHFVSFVDRNSRVISSPCVA